LYVTLYRLYGILYPGQGGFLKRAGKRCWGIVRRNSVNSIRSLVKRSLNWAAWEGRLQAMEESLTQLATRKALPLPSEEPFVEVCRIRDQVLMFSDPAYGFGLAVAVRRMGDDYYLSQTAIFREGDTVVDVGAHIGVVSIYLAKKYPFIRVYAVEPEPMNYGCLQRNIELNGVRNVIPINKAVSGDGRKKRLYADPWDSGWATMDARLACSRGPLRTVEVESVTLEQLFEEYEIRHCRLLKITAPGAVREALGGLTRPATVDLLCGEADVADCSRAKLEMASWRIARQHFWRTISRKVNGTMYSWIHQIPAEIEQLAAQTSSSVNINEAGDGKDVLADRVVFLTTTGKATTGESNPFPD